MYMFGSIFPTVFYFGPLEADLSILVWYRNWSLALRIHPAVFVAVSLRLYMISIVPHFKNIKLKHLVVTAVKQEWLNCCR